MALSKTKNPALFFIFITVVIDTIGLGIIIPVIPTLIRELIQGNLSDASTYGGWLMFAYASTQFFFASILGNLSDRFGRRPVLLLSLLGFAINYLLMGWAPTIGWLFIGRLIAGVTGASHTVAAAYIADVSPIEKRAQNFGLLGAAFGLGFIIGPVLGGILGHYGPRVPFYAAAILCFVNFAYGFFVVPESLAPEKRRPFSWRQSNPIGSFKHIKRFPTIGVLVSCIFLINVAAHALQSTWSYYTMEKFEWNEQKVGISLGFIGLLLAIVQAGLLRVIIPRFGAKNSVILGLVLYTISLPLIGLANSSFMLMATCIPYVLGGIAGPAMQGIISNEVPNNEQGQIQGGLTSIVSLTAIVGPPIMTWLFAYFTDRSNPWYIPGMPFIFASLLTGISLILIWNNFKKKKPTSVV